MISDRRGVTASDLMWLVYEITWSADIKRLLQEIAAAPTQADVEVILADFAWLFARLHPRHREDVCGQIAALIYEKP